MDNKSDAVFNLLAKWSCEEILIEFADQILNEKITDPLSGIRKENYRGFALNIEDALEFAYIKCTIPSDVSLVRTSYENPDTLAIYFFFDSSFDYIVENQLEKNVEGLINGIIIHNYSRTAKIPLLKGHEFNYVIIRIKKTILEKYFNLISGELEETLFVRKPVLLYENLNSTILSYLHSIGRIKSNKSVSRYLIFSMTLGLLALTFDLLFERNEESKTIESIPGYEKVINARNYLLSDLKKTPTVKRLSRFMGMSETNAKLLFRSVMGYPVYQYFKMKKMETAYRLIIETDDDMTEISRQLGYRNPSQFSADFKKHFGVLPKKLSLQINKSKE